MPQLQHRSVVAGFTVRQPHIGDEDDLLLHVVKGDDLIEEHEIHVPEPLGILGGPVRRRLAVKKVVIGKVAYKTAGEGWQVIRTRAFVIRKYLPQHGGRVPCLDFHMAGGELSVHTGNAHFRIAAQKCVPPPFLALLRRFQQIAVRRNVFENPHGFDGRDEIGKDFAADRHDAVNAVFRFLQHIIQSGADVH